MSDIGQLRREIEELEKQIASHPFEGLFDRKRTDQLYHKLKKKRKELERLESGGGAVPAPGAPATARAERPAPVPVETAARPVSQPKETRPLGGASPTVRDKIPAKPKPVVKSKTMAKTPAKAKPSRSAGKKTTKKKAR